MKKRHCFHHVSLYAVLAMPVFTSADTLIATNVRSYDAAFSVPRHTWNIPYLKTNAYYEVFLAHGQELDDLNYDEIFDDTNGAATILAKEVFFAGESVEYKPFFGFSGYEDSEPVIVTDNLRTNLHLCSTATSGLVFPSALPLAFSRRQNGNIPLFLYRYANQDGGSEPITLNILKADDVQRVEECFFMPDETTFTPTFPVEIDSATNTWAGYVELAQTNHHTYVTTGTNNSFSYQWSPNNGMDVPISWEEQTISGLTYGFEHALGASANSGYLAIRQSSPESCIKIYRLSGDTYELLEVLTQSLTGNGTDAYSKLDMWITTIGHNTDQIHLAWNSNHAIYYWDSATTTEIVPDPTSVSLPHKLVASDDKLHLFYGIGTSLYSKEIGTFPPKTVHFDGSSTSGWYHPFGSASLSVEFDEELHSDVLIFDRGGSCYGRTDRSWQSTKKRLSMQFQRNGTCSNFNFTVPVSTSLGTKYINYTFAAGTNSYDGTYYRIYLPNQAPLDQWVDFHRDLEADIKSLTPTATYSTQWGIWTYGGKYRIDYIASY